MHMTGSFSLRVYLPAGAARELRYITLRAQADKLSVAAGQLTPSVNVDFTLVSVQFMTRPGKRVEPTCLSRERSSADDRMPG